MHEEYAAQLRRRHRASSAFAWFCSISTWLSVLILAVLLTAVTWEAAGALSWRFLVRYDSRNAENAGVIAGLLGSIWLIGLTALFCVPIGVGAAVYLEEYAKPSWFTRLIQLNISNLAGVPSIVYGILGFTAFVRMFGIAKEAYRVHLGFTTLNISLPFGRSLLSGALTMTLLSLPVVIIAAQEALRAVPPSIRHAAFALGATKWQTIRHQVLPAALPGILTGVILAMSRAIGETAPLAVIGAATYITFAPGKIDSLSDLATNPGGLLQAPFDGFTVLPMQIYNWVMLPNAAFRQVTAAGIVVLLVVLFMMNSAAIVIRQRFQQKIRW